MPYYGAPPESTAADKGPGLALAASVDKTGDAVPAAAPAGLGRRKKDAARRLAAVRAALG